MGIDVIGKEHVTKKDMNYSENIFYDGLYPTHSLYIISINWTTMIYIGILQNNLWKGNLIQYISKEICRFNSRNSVKWDIYVIKCSVVIGISKEPKNDE